MSSLVAGSIGLVVVVAIGLIVFSEGPVVGPVASLVIVGAIGLVVGATGFVAETLVVVAETLVAVVAANLISTKAVIVFINVLDTSIPLVVAANVLVATKRGIDEAVALNLEAIAVVSVVAVVAVIGTKILVVGVGVVFIALLPVETMALPLTIALLTVVSLDPGLTGRNGSSTDNISNGHASMLEHMGRVVVVLVVIRANASGDALLDMRLRLELKLKLGLDWRWDRK